ncbi:proline-, glutamic acid- and leucine-rich protein 1 [Drosophila willistoni]|uniref:proline-, glutamic acid- and leucine-rich protein 1 n=1 Tax=Drosophila willistoni TaxID=7260 RepID=UPI001F081888|nr:proline-, glutamic acid- and leucine-rich protein 1 [Drosophila willistoni]
MKMSGIESIFQSIANANPKSRNIYLDAINKNHTISDDKNVATQTITSMLSKSTSRAIGLRFLIAYLDQDMCSTGVLEKKAHIWLASIMKSCNAMEIRSYGHLIYEALALLIKRIQSTFDVAKTFASTYLFKFFESLSLQEIRDNIPSTISSLNALEQCLRYYPGPSKSGRAMVHKFLASLVDSSDVDVIHGTGQCWLMLQQVRGGAPNDGENKDKGQWRDFQLGILGNLHDLLNVTISSQDEIFERPAISTKLDYFELVLEGDPIERSARVCRRFCNLVDYLKIALSEPFPVKKCIYPKRILNLIQRGLGLKLTSYRNNSNIDNLCFGSLLPELHFKLLELLEVLITICNTHLRMHFRLILSILLDSLKNTKPATSKEPQENFVNLRSSVYKVITLWCSVLNDGSRCEIISDYLIKEILDDVRPVVTNKSSELQRPNNLPRRKKDVQLLNNEVTGIVKTSSLCQEAFRCLQNLLHSSGHLIKHTIIKDVYNTLLIICIQMQQNLHSKSEQPHDWKYRAEIYKTLTIIVQSRNFRCPPPTEIILYLLDETRSRDSSSEVRLWCQNLIDTIENMLHPQKESVFFKRDLRSSTSTSEEETVLLNDNNISAIEDESGNNEMLTSELDTDIEAQPKDTSLMEVGMPNDTETVEDVDIPAPPANIMASKVIENIDISPPPSDVVPPNSSSHLPVVEEKAPVKIHKVNDLKESNVSGPKVVSEIKNLSPDDSSKPEENYDIDDSFVEELNAAFVNEFW